MYTEPGYCSYMTSVQTLMLHMFISQERYRAVVNLFEWKPYSRRTHLELGVMWTVAVIMGVLGVLQGSQIIGETDDIISCFTSSWTTERLFPGQITILIIVSLSGPASLLFCIIHYICIFRQLHTIRKIHNTNGVMPTRIDIPIQWESEVRALKSLAIVFFMAVVPYIFCVSINYVVVDSIALIHHRKFSDVDLPLSLMFCVSFYDIANLRSHVSICSEQKIQSELFKWQLKPDSTVYINSTAGISKNNSLRVAIPQHKCEGGTIKEPVLKPPSPSNILYNTWVGDSAV